MLVGHFLIVGLAAWAAATCFALVTGEASAQSFLTRTGTFSVSDVAIATAYMLVSFAVIDFISYAIHYLQHKMPLLWQFHKVHHSAEVMHPIVELPRAPDRQPDLQSDDRRRTYGVGHRPCREHHRLSA